MYQDSILEAKTRIETEFPIELSLADEFELALKTHGLHLNYQPIVDLSSGEIVGFEALMRWKHPTRGFISPGEFIPVAEESGQITEASRWALEEACYALRRIQKKSSYANELFMSVNFSSQDFEENNFLDTLYQTLSTTDVQPNRLHLEITQDLLNGGCDNTKETLLLCNSVGLGISLDDFDANLLTTPLLDDFKIAQLKIDRKYTSKIIENLEIRNFVQNLIQVCQSKNIRTIAEGVETGEEVKLLHTLGCDEAQGYYFMKPLDEKIIIDSLIAWTPTGLA